MGGKAGRVLNIALIDDDPEDLEIHAAAVRDAIPNSTVAVFTEPPEKLSVLRNCDLLIIDNFLGNGQLGTDVIASARALGFKGRVVLLTGMVRDGRVHDYYVAKEHYAYFQKLCHFLAGVLNDDN